MKRINIMGPTGAGKTHLARKLAEIYDLPVVHIDGIGLSAKYDAMNNKPAFLKKVNAEIDKDRWIMEGVFNSTLGQRIKRAELNILLDLPRRVYVYRVFKRRFMYRNKKRPEMPANWKEKIDKGYLKYVLTYHKKKTPIIKQAIDDQPGANVVVVKSNKELRELLARLKSEQ